MPTTPIPVTNLKRRVRGYIRARVPREEAEDVIQDAWLKIVKDWPKYDPKKGPPWPFAKFRCQNAIKDYYRRRPPSDGEMAAAPAASPEPSPSDYERLLQVTFAAPSELHQLIAFAYVQLLEWKPADVVTHRSDEALEDLGNRFVVEYSRQFPSHHRNAILDLLRPFTERLRGERGSLADRFDAPDDPKHRAVEVSRWRHTVQRRIQSDFFFQHSLDALLTSRRPPHEQIVHGLVIILGWTPRRLAEKHCHESLEKLAERFERGCRARRPHLGGLIQRIFRPLHQDPSLKDQTLCDHVPEGQDPADVFARWSTPSEGREP